MARARASGRPTIADVAERAGVAAITVSRALRSPDKVSPRLRETIDHAVRELQYVPDLNARALASRRTDIVAVLVPSLSQNIFSEVIRGVFDGLEDSSLHIEIISTRYSIELEEQQVRRVLRHHPAAVIISGTEQSAATRRMLEKAPCPVVQIMDMTDDPIQKIIGFSHLKAGYTITRHLIEEGYRRVGYFSGWLNGRSSQRLDGYRMALEEAGLYDPDLVSRMGHDEPTRTNDPNAHLFASAGLGRVLMSEMLERRPDMDAVFCNNDVVALGALFACNAFGVKVPTEMGIAGFNDFDYMAAAHPPLTSLRIHRWQCGYEAMLAVRQQLDGAAVGEPIVDLGFAVMKRASTNRQGRPGDGHVAPTLTPTRA